jgi:hypothetical protein
MSCAGHTCPKCHECHLTYLRLSDEWEKRLISKWGQGLCELCKRGIMMDNIRAGLALAWDLPGHVTTNAR